MTRRDIKNGLGEAAAGGTIRGKENRKFMEIQRRKVQRRRDSLHGIMRT
jgi:hypothetical protein